jgi:hypothetical protein
MANRARRSYLLSTPDRPISRHTLPFATTPTQVSSRERPLADDLHGFCIFFERDRWVRILDQALKNKMGAGPRGCVAHGAGEMSISPILSIQSSASWAALVTSLRRR